MTAQICNYFVTLQSNDTCEFCRQWQGLEDQDSKLAEYQTVIAKLDEIATKGVKTIVFTGGEPLLRGDLPDLLQKSKELGIKNILYTNGLLFESKADAIKDNVDSLYFHLDYPFAEAHDRSRGIECFAEVIEGLKQSKKKGINARINFNLTRDSVLYLPEMLDLAEKLGIVVCLCPVESFQGLQGFSRETILAIKYSLNRKQTLANLTMLDLVKQRGNNIMFPRCRAKETTLTMLPDGQMVSPCFYNRGGRQGREPVCFACMRWLYMLPSFGVGIDKYFWLGKWSEFLNKRKGINI